MQPTYQQFVKLAFELQNYKDESPEIEAMFDEESFNPFSCAAIAKKQLEPTFKNKTREEVQQMIGRVISGQYEDVIETILTHRNKHLANNFD